METICAIATAPGGAIGIIRVSGPEAIALTEKIFRPAAPPSLTERPGHSLSFGHIITPQGNIVDEVLVSLFRAPHSYTGEESTEISCHGSAYILQEVMHLLVEAGCRTAEPGEFTQRAFLNGKMDLSQAEAVADLIASSSEAAHRLAINQMRGGFSKELRDLRDNLLNINSLLELELDFSDHEELEFADRTELQKLAAHIEEHIARLCESFRLGNALKNGVPVAIIGQPNAGKSTLLNALVGEERAIVSDIPGTTRDVIEDTTTIDGVLYRFIDTAGLRDTADTIETLGIERAYEKAGQAEILLWMIDCTHAMEQYTALATRIISLSTNKQLILLLNKSDIYASKSPTLPELIHDIKNLLATSLQESTSPQTSCSLSQAISSPIIIPFSARNAADIAELRHQIAESSPQRQQAESNTIVSNIRHYEALQHALAAIRRVLIAIPQDIPGDLISQDLRECIHYLSEITGDITTDMTLQNIFKHFCIGK